MKTSIINKIVVIFLILVMITSFVLIICMQYAIAEYNDRYVVQKADEMMKLALDRAEEEISFCQREAELLLNVLRDGGAGWEEAAAAVQAIAPKGNGTISSVYLFRQGAASLWTEGELLRLSEQETEAANSMAGLLRRTGSPNSEQQEVRQSSGAREKGTDTKHESSGLQEGRNPRVDDLAGGDLRVNDLKGGELGGRDLAVWGERIICGFAPDEQGIGAVVVLHKDFFRQYVYKEEALVNLTVKTSAEEQLAGPDRAELPRQRALPKIQNGHVFGTAELRNLEAVYQLDYDVLSSGNGDGGFIYFIIIVCLLLLISAFILARYLVEKIGKPLEILIEEMQDMDSEPSAAGAADVRLIDKASLRIQEDDEIGLLIDSFNTMKLELSDSMCELERQNARLEAVFKNIASSVVIIEENYRIQMMNDSGGCFFSCTNREENTGRKCYEAFAGRETPCVKCPVGRLAPGVGEEMAQNGKVLKITHTVIHYIDGRRVILVVSGDRTQEYLTNREMVELDKLAQIGKVAAAITHEVKNPLAVIKSGIYYLERMERDKVPQYIFEKEFAETIRMIKESLGYAENTTQSFLSFSRVERRGGSRAIGLSAMLDQVMVLYSHDMMKKRIRVVRELNVNGLSIDMDAEIFKTILLNLISNAMEVMENGGTITIRSDLTSEDCYRICVADRGSGIPEKELGNVFQLFYTTKENGTNAGVGLWIVENEVKKAGGRVTAANNADGGAAITMFLPRRRRNEKQKENSADRR